MEEGSLTSEPQLAGHGKDHSRVQLSLFDRKALGSRCCGWIETHLVKRTRKSGDIWEGEQFWLHWEEVGGKKRSRYIPKSKLKFIQESVYELHNPIGETLKLLEKK